MGPFLKWNPTSNGTVPPMEPNLQWDWTSNGTEPLMGLFLKWNQPLMGLFLQWNPTSNGTVPPMEPNLQCDWTSNGTEPLMGLFLKWNWSSSETEPPKIEPHIAVFVLCLPRIYNEKNETMSVVAALYWLTVLGRERACLFSHDLTSVDTTATTTEAFFSSSYLI